MSLDDKRVFAVFYLSDEDGRPIDMLLDLAGATDVAPDRYEEGRMVCRWGSLPCEAELAKFPGRSALVISFYSSALNGLLNGGSDGPESREGDDLPLAFIFRDACLALRAEAAFIQAYYPRATEDLIVAMEREVRIKNARVLADNLFAVLFLNDELRQYLPSDGSIEERDTLATNCGVIMFDERNADLHPKRIAG